MAPSFFADCGKTVTDLFKAKKYNFGQAFEVKHSTSTFETTSKLNADKKNGEITVKYSDKSFGNVEVTTATSDKLDGKIVFSKLADGLKVTVSGEDAKSKSAAVEAKYQKDSVAAVGKLSLAGDQAVVSVDAVVGYDGLAVGGAVVVNASKQELTDYNAVIQYTQNNWQGTLKTAQSLDSLTASVSNKVDSNTLLGAEFKYNLSNETRGLVVGGSYQLDAETLIKAKIDNASNVNAVWQHRLNTNATLSLGLATQTDLSNSKVGFKLELAGF